MVHHSPVESVIAMVTAPCLDQINSTDATRGQRLCDRVLARKNELEDARADCGPYDVLRRQLIDTALATVYSLITGDLAHPSDVVARDLNRWLERHKHLA